MIEIPNNEIPPHVRSIILSYLKNGKLIEYIKVESCKKHLKLDICAIKNMVNELLLKIIISMLYTRGGEIQINLYSGIMTSQLVLMEVKVDCSRKRNSKIRLI